MQRQAGKQFYKLVVTACLRAGPDCKLHCGNALSYARQGHAIRFGQKCGRNHVGTAFAKKNLHMKFLKRNIKHVLLALLLAAVAVSLSGCLWVGPDHDRGWHHDHDHDYDHDHDHHD